MNKATVLEAPPLLDYEFVITGADFFVSLNGDCKPSECIGYSVDRNGSFVLHQAVTEILTLPIPSALRVLLEGAEDVWFVKFKNGKVADSKVLARVQRTIH